MCVLSGGRRSRSVHRRSGMGCRVSGEWQSEQLTASEVVSGGFLLQEVSLSELSGTVMCIRLCKRPPEKRQGGGGE